MSAPDVPGGGELKGGNPPPPIGGGGKDVLGGWKLGTSSGGGAGNVGTGLGGGNPKLATGGGMLELKTPGTGGGGKLDLSGMVVVVVILEVDAGGGKLGTPFTGGGNSSNTTPFLKEPGADGAEFPEPDNGRGMSEGSTFPLKDELSSVGSSFSFASLLLS